MKRSAAALITIPLGVLLAAGVGMSVATAASQSVPANTTPAVTAQHDPVHYPTGAPAPVTTRSHVTTHPTPAATAHRKSTHRTVTATPHTTRHTTTTTSTYGWHDGCDHYGTGTSSQHMGNSNHW